MLIEAPIFSHSYVSLAWNTALSSRRPRIHCRLSHRHGCTSKLHPDALWQDVVVALQLSTARIQRTLVTWSGNCYGAVAYTMMPLFITHFPLHKEGMRPCALVRSLVRKSLLYFAVWLLDLALPYHHLVFCLQSAISCCGRLHR